MTTPQGEAAATAAEVAPAAALAGENGETRPLVWSEALSVGVPEIDADHQVLLDLIGQLDTLGRSAAEGDPAESHGLIGTVLAALADYTEYHFAREERMLQALAYPELPTHHSIHEGLKQQVADYLHRYDTDREAVDLGDLFRFLLRWLVDHIMQEDKLYMPHCADNPRAHEAIASVGLEFFIDPDIQTL